MIFVIHKPSSRCATTFSFAHGTFLYNALLVVVVKRAASKMSVAFGTGDSKFVERARRTGHEIATRLVTDARDFTCVTLYKLTS